MREGVAHEAELRAADEVRILTGGRLHLDAARQARQRHDLLAILVQRDREKELSIDGTHLLDEHAIDSSAFEAPRKQGGGCRLRRRDRRRT